ncbi:MAG: phage Gp37/Gp68 family protein [Bacteroidetes bacterium]|nr:phage Gp37/Gp68 family protein [Bacteroidota bacterium]
MTQSSIEWTELTWNPTTGCTKISAGCKNCYAEVMSRRLKAMGQKKYQNNFKITIHPQELMIPYNWKGSRMVFVNSMSDMFHEKVPLEFIQAVFTVMNNTPQHTYQILTKRSERLKELSPALNWTDNIWMGVSVENEKVVHRITDLAGIGARLKFLSIEPLIGPIKSLPLENISWVIVGGESGHGARPIKKEWVDFVHQQCREHGVSFFFKQWGKPHFNFNQNDPTIAKSHPQHAKGGCQLNGEVYRELPVSFA